MPKNSSNSSDNEAQYPVDNSTETSARIPYSKILLRLVLAMAILITAFPWLYEIKSRAGINIVEGVHAGTFLEQHTGGLIKCQWLYPYHCDSDRMTKLDKSPSTQFRRHRVS
jgi:hypothetical protein